MDLSKNYFLKAKFYKNSEVTKARNLKFGQIISLYMKLCTCILGGAMSCGLGQTCQKLVITKLIHDFNNEFSLCAHMCCCGLVVKGAST